MSKYEMRINWDAADGIYVVEVPELAGCMAHGVTRSEAIANAEDAVSAWVEAAIEMGQVVPEPNVRGITA
ncbi:MAG: type II toxin-antitoxin system HicB family antitoxin [Clostridia bacterium]|nr:type II toxin-antitoxin system HicB family antitoxin [Clostridia bacterium]